MPVMRLGFAIRLEPFLQAAIGSDLIGREPGALLRQFALQFLIQAEQLRGAGRIAEQLPQLLHVDGRAHADIDRPAIGEEKGIFRRVRGAGHQPFVHRFFPDVVEIELRAAFQNRIRPLQVFAVEREGILIPQVRTQPSRPARGRAPGGLLARRSETPGIRDDMRDPAARVVIRLRRFAPRLHQRRDELVQRFLQLRQIADERRPVVHLHIDVEVPVSVPRRLDFLGPDALQIRRQAPRA